jgi:hypothetical protein
MILGTLHSARLRQSPNLESSYPANEDSCKLVPALNNTITSSSAAQTTVVSLLTSSALQIPPTSSYKFFSPFKSLPTSAFIPLQFPTSSLLLCLFLKLHPRTSTDHTTVQYTLTTNKQAQPTHANTRMDLPSPTNKLMASSIRPANPATPLMSAVDSTAATKADRAPSWVKKRFV